MTEVKVIEPFKYGGETLEEGTVVDLPDGVAQSAIDRGYAEETGGEEAPDPDEGLDVGDYMRSGRWLTVEGADVEEGDRMTVEGSGRMDDRFEDEYLVVPVSYQGLEYNLRLGKRNTKRIADGFGTKVKDWVGEEIEVAAIQKYEGVNAKGMILKPVESGK
ncbi:hypothetical protein AKJ64_04210 [candidate division MSBL1 archaeon SCGC-AAA259E17]|uniref:Uncharacterized protein n=1 Tax=candidate division MSBL1 archaeon SCGC-AAA259E17 TaxID=1698263 RepID=A0A133UCX3_9EURY|nr:hypothetical protein AKJ64_04210 [candidate division MSBL1 archaeon SCGC-AAA259E17]